MSMGKPSRLALSGIEMMTPALTARPVLRDRERKLITPLHCDDSTADKESFRRRLGQRLIETRTELDISPVTVAGACRLSTGTLGCIETGRQMMTAYELARAADLFHVTTDELLGRPPQAKGQKLPARVQAMYARYKRMSFERRRQFIYLIDTALLADARRDLETATRNEAGPRKRGRLARRD
jgi:transcriptional regulator with XRE-family HTH domain